jgi:hypothetical protein
LMLLPRKDFGRNFPRHTSADDEGLLCAENTESSLVYSNFHLLCLGARDVLRRGGTRDRFGTFIWPQFTPVTLFLLFVSEDYPTGRGFFILM